MYSCSLLNSVCYKRIDPKKFMIRYDETSGKKRKHKKYIQSFKLKENKLFNELKIKSRKKN